MALVARQLRDGEFWRTVPGDPRGSLEVRGAGYWIVADGDEEWPVRSDIFAQTYVYKADIRSDRIQPVERFIWTSLLRMDREFRVMSPESLAGPQIGQRGDFLAFGAFDDCWMIPADVVDEKGLYEEIPLPEGNTPNIFLSYSRGDAKAGGIDVLAALEKYLRGNDRVMRTRCNVFFDRNRLTGGEPWREEILEAIACADLVAVIVGKSWLFRACESGEGVAFLNELPLAVLNTRRRGQIVTVAFDISMSKLEESPTVLVLNGYFRLDGSTAIGPLESAQLDEERVAAVGKILIEKASDAMTARRSIPSPHFDEILGPVPARDPAPAPRPAPETSPDDTAPISLTTRRVEPSYLGPRVDGAWVALHGGDEPTIITVDGASLVGLAEQSDEVADLVFGRPIDAVVASDDGTALAVLAGGRLRIVETGARPRVWPSLSVELPSPTARPLAMLRSGRTYAVQVSDEERRHVLVADSGGVARERVPPASGGAVMAAVSGSEFIDMADDRGPRAVKAVRGLSKAGLRTWLSIDGAKETLGRSSVDVLAGLGRTKAGDTILAVQRGAELRALPVDPKATSVAVTRAAPIGESLVIIQIGDELSGWRVDEIPLLA